MMRSAPNGEFTSAQRRLTVVGLTICISACMIGPKQDDPFRPGGAGDYPPSAEDAATGDTFPAPSTVPLEAGTLPTGSDAAADGRTGGDAGVPDGTVDVVEPLDVRVDVEDAGGEAASETPTTDGALEAVAD